MTQQVAKNAKSSLNVWLIMWPTIILIRQRKYLAKLNMYFHNAVFVIFFYLIYIIMLGVYS